LKGPWPPHTGGFIILLRHLVGLLWTSAQLVAKASTYTGQYKTETQRQTSMPWAEFESTIPVTKRPKPTNCNVTLCRMRWLLPAAQSQPVWRYYHAIGSKLHRNSWLPVRGRFERLFPGHSAQAAEYMYGVLYYDTIHLLTYRPVNGRPDKVESLHLCYDPSW
jgi:hypothetical protein